MAGGTSFHRVILQSEPGVAMSKSKSTSTSNSNSNSNSNGNGNGFLISKNQTPRFSARSGASLNPTLYVSLDNADKVIEGGPPFITINRFGVPRPLRFFQKGGCVRNVTSLEQP
jgi:hypothetical protein